MEEKIDCDSKNRPTVREAKMENEIYRCDREIEMLQKAIICLAKLVVK